MTNLKLWIYTLSALIFLLLTSYTYAFWSQNIATYQGVQLKSDTVTYFDTYILSGNEETILPPSAVKNSLAENSLTTEGNVSVCENTVIMTLLSQTLCDITVNVNIEYLYDENYISLPDNILGVELWCDFDLDDTILPYQLAYDTNNLCYVINDFVSEQISSLLIRTYFTVSDELLDTVYQNTQFKIILAFTAYKQVI